jgi:hypothetical protein
MTRSLMVTSTAVQETTVAAAGDADPFLAFHAQRLLDAGYTITARREDCGGRYEITVALADAEVARGDGEFLAEALSHAMILGGL